MRTLLILLSIASAAGAAEVALRAEAVVERGTIVRLGDLASVTGADADRVANTPLMPSPAPGSRQFVSAGAIRDMLAAQGIAGGTNRFRGAYRVQLSTRANTPESAPTRDWRAAPETTPQPSKTAFRIVQRATPDAVTQYAPRTRRLGAVEADAVRQAVSETLQAEVDARRTEPGAPRLAVKSVMLSATALRELAGNRDEPLTGAFEPTAQLAAGQQQARVWPKSKFEGEPFRVVVELVVQPMRVVATAPLGRGALVTASSVRVEPVPVEQIGRPGSAGFAALEEVIGKEAQRRINTGDVLSDANTAPPVMVHRGELVKVFSGGGGVSVSIDAKAKQDGRVGDLISVELLDRREQLMARVTGHRRLAVLSAGPALADVTSTGGLR